MVSARRWRRDSLAERHDSRSFDASFVRTVESGRKTRPPVEPRTSFGFFAALKVIVGLIFALAVAARLLLQAVA